MAYSKPNVLVFGHSFIKRLHHSIIERYHDSFTADFGLNQCNVSLRGYSGLTVELNKDRLYSVVEGIFPQNHFDASVIQLGSNDIGYSTPENIASSLIQLAQKFLDHYGVKVVYICQVFTPTNPRDISPEDYEICRQQINEHLRSMLDRYPRIKFWLHCRIFHSPHPIFLMAEGVHLNLVIGMQMIWHIIYRYILMSDDIDDMIRKVI